MHKGSAVQEAVLQDHDLVLKDIGGQKIRDEYIKEKSWEKSKKKFEYHVTTNKVEMMSDDDDVE